jgi:hypothetical protein
LTIESFVSIFDSGTTISIFERLAPRVAITELGTFGNCLELQKFDVIAAHTTVFVHGVLRLDVEVEPVTLSATLFVDVCSTALEMAVILFETSLVFARFSVSILK